MKKIILAVICCALFKNASTQISDSTAKIFSNYICTCIDTLDPKKPEAELRKQISLCKTISLTRLLNERLITPDLLTDEKLATELEKKGLTYLATHCESIKLLMEALNKEPVFDQTNEGNLFTPSAFFETYGLKKGETNTRLHVYNNFGEGAVKYQRVVDIRWTFKTEADALKWHQMNLQKNAEDGKPVEVELSIRGATAVRAFREGPAAAEMMKALGIAQRHHYFLFVYKNIVCKVFIATDEKTNTVEVAPFAIAAATQLEAVVK